MGEYSTERNHPKQRGNPYSCAVNLSPLRTTRMLVQSPERCATRSRSWPARCDIQQKARLWDIDQPSRFRNSLQGCDVELCPAPLVAQDDLVERIECPRVAGPVQYDTVSAPAFRRAPHSRKESGSASGRPRGCPPGARELEDDRAARPLQFRVSGSKRHKKAPPSPANLLHGSRVTR